MVNRPKIKSRKKCLYAIRDVDRRKESIYTNTSIQKISRIIRLIDEGRVKIIVIPDIESVNYGRSVGYDVIEHEPPSDIKSISEKIREQGVNNLLITLTKI